MSIYTFKPTYLYVKQHSKTGLKYFGKTTKIDPYQYKGSGKYWQRHIKKHGKEFVETIWVKLFHNREECVKFALQFSVENNIVQSTDWANMKPENGLDGNTSEQAKLINRKLVNEGRHNFQKRADNSSLTMDRNKKLVSEGNHHFLKKQDGTSINLGRKHTENSKIINSLSKMGNKNSLGFKQNEETITKRVEKNKKLYFITSPNGDEFVIKGLSQFCKQNGLTTSLMHAVKNGLQTNHKGWKCKLLPPN